MSQTPESKEEKPAPAPTRDLSKVPVGQEQNEAEAGIRAKAIEAQLKKALNVPADDETEPSPTKTHAFWGTQPVPAKPSEQVKSFEEAHPLEDVEEKMKHIRKTPLPLPQEFEWFNLDETNDEQLTELYTLLRENYVSDSDAWFRFAYSKPMLKWAINAPGTVKEYKCGVRVAGTSTMVAFISAVPTVVAVGGGEIKAVIIDFLCVHKSLREKRLAPVLIKEITRRVNLRGTFQAVYTAGTVIPTPYTAAHYYHRSISVEKLLDVHFTGIPKMMNVPRLKKLYRVEDAVETPGWRKFRGGDAPVVREKLNEYLRSNFKVAQLFKTDEDVIHSFKPRPNIVYSFVAESPTKDIDAFGSFYCVTNECPKSDKHPSIEIGYIYYYFTNGRVPLVELIGNLIVEAKKVGMDVVNALDVMKNKEMFTELKFGKGDGTLNYYLFNFNIPALQPEENGIVLI
ncbi:putative Glycylpeptide N-tetradecanoyltransferase [Blattamonas nauphoetae]|uniref:Glycylpeptide N-tetradecanoyltransferase n=1 Tax=Blattamonas nauphoetae TaxID=2049346 RepID=A0ABQ9YJC3_9EUKA|nr:putative Glycylpeptide N-tetradecanoyltransferase [Blattamonas nauphoetae]